MKTFNISTQSGGVGEQSQDSLFFQNHPVYRFSSQGFLSIFILDRAISVIYDDRIISSSWQSETFQKRIWAVSTFSKVVILHILHMLKPQYVVGCLLKARKEIMSGTANSADVWETDHKSIEHQKFGLDGDIPPCYKDIPVWYK